MRRCIHQALLVDHHRLVVIQRFLDADLAHRVVALIGSQVVEVIEVANKESLCEK